MDGRNDFIKITGKESDINTLKSIAEDNGYSLDDAVEFEVFPDEDVKPGEKVVVNPDNLRYAAQVAKKTADDIEEFSPDKILAKVPEISSIDTESSSYREWRKLFDDFSQRFSGRFHNISFDRLLGSSVAVKDNSVESDLTLPSEDLNVEDLVNSSDISLDNVDNRVDSIFEMDEMFLDGDSNLDAIDKSFSKSR